MLSRRERIIAILTVTALGALVLDAYVLGPLEERRGRLEAERAAYTAELASAERLFEARARSDRRWREMLDAGLGSDASAAQRRLLHAVRAAADEAGLAVGSMQPERATPEGRIGRLAVGASGSGDIGAISRFLYLLERAELPVRLHRVRIAGGESGGRLSLDARISTIYLTGSGEGGIAN